MSLPPPTFASLHAVLGFSGPSLSPERDEALVEALKSTFPNQVQRTVVPPGAPPQTPSLVVASSSSQLLVSAVQADFHVGFYGAYSKDVEQALGYVEDKLAAALKGLEDVGRRVVMAGLIGKLQFSFQGLEGESPVGHLLAHHISTEVDPEQVQDVNSRIALRIQDRYYVSFALSNYELRVVQQMVGPGMQTVRLDASQGRVEDTGLELTVDVNNKLQLSKSADDTVLRENDIALLTGMMRDIAMTSGPKYVSTGEIMVDELAGSTT